MSERQFHEHFGCALCAFRLRVRGELRCVPQQPPATLGKPYEFALPPMRLVAWDWFALRWFPASGHALRDSRLLMLPDPVDVPTRFRDYCSLVTGRAIHCRLCIPIDHFPALGLPPIQPACLKGGEAHGTALRKSR